MANSANGPHERKPALWLGTRGAKIERCFPLGIARFVRDLSRCTKVFIRKILFVTVIRYTVIFKSGLHLKARKAIQFISFAYDWLSFQNEVELCFNWPVSSTGRAFHCLRRGQGLRHRSTGFPRFSWSIDGNCEDHTHYFEPWYSCQLI